jgi:hypothetical protein
MPPMQDIDNGVCIHHEGMCKLISEIHDMVKNIDVKLGGNYDKKGMITEHCEMYEYFIETKNNKKSIVQGAIGYVLIALLGGIGTLLAIGIKAIM